MKKTKIGSKLLAVLLSVALATSLSGVTFAFAEGVDEGGFSTQVGDALACVECGASDGHVEGCSLAEAPEPSLFESLMAATDAAEMHALLVADPEGADALSADKINALFDLVDGLDPEGDDPATEQLTDLLISLPNFVSGAERDGEDAAGYADVDSSYIYFDLYYGDVMITDNAYSGKLGGQDVRGTHSDGNKYYVFQSTGTGTDYTVSTANGKKLPSAIPDYDRVGAPSGTQDADGDGKVTWGDYITNHPNGSTTQTHVSADDTSDSVNTVIKAWGSCEDDSYEHKADGNNSISSVTSGAAIDAGRTPTNHRITVRGITDTAKTFDVTIDDIWSIYQDKYWSYSIYGGFAFNTYYKNKVLKLTFRGDNRFGNMHMATLGDAAGNVFGSSDGWNMKGENFTFGTGNADSYGVDPDCTNTAEFYGWDDGSTLTVANVSAGKKWQGTNSAIGGSDMNDYSVRMKFYSGTVYAGTTPEDFCSAIGGGGNGDGNVEIYGGKVTAVNNSTGTAIGGGCGTLGHGGYGNVSISGGEVYAYSYALKNIGFANWCNDSLPTAIGGGSSSTQVGGTGIVSIMGGKVYAYSEVGNAIGGGGGGIGYYSENNYNTYGGAADVSISGTAVVDAISGSGCAIGGGPGGGKLYAEHLVDGQLPNATYGMGALDQPVVCDGGTAKLTISGSPTVRAGSIGGGSPLEQNRVYGAAVGAAVVNISGGIIHGQVVMDGVIKNAPEGIGLTNGNFSSFTMSGGLIDNTPIGDAYRFVEENGGAVYINSGNATMSGGAMQNCSSPLGGAIYVIGGDFSLSGSGRIANCAATGGDAYGGAVYASGGKVVVSGGLIEKCEAASGGAIYVGDGTFSMTGGALEKNVAASSGGAVCIVGGSCEMTGGAVSKNSAVNGGGVYVSNTSVAFGGSGSIAVTGNAASGNGGGFYLDQSGSSKPETISITNGSISGNSADGLGGGVYQTGSKGSCSISGSGTVSSNSAANGGGIYIAGGSVLTVSGGSVTGNEAKGDPNAGKSESDEKVTTAKNDGASCGVGGGVYVAAGSIATDMTNFTMQAGEGLMVGIYGNKAEFAAADAYSSGTYTILTLPNVDGMELSGTYATAGSWYEDYPDVETAYPKDPAICTGRYSKYATNNVVVDKVVRDEEYLCLTLGINNTLVVKKTLAEPASEDQTFVFTVVGQGEASANPITVTVVIKKGSTEGVALITRIPEGTYLVAEGAWAWRYDETKESKTVVKQAVFNADTASVTVPFVNEIVDDRWLSGDDYNENKFGAFVAQKA